MPDANQHTEDSIVVMTADAVGEAVQQIARQIAERYDDMNAVALLGILRRGRPLADRLAKEIGALTGDVPRVGSLATTLYRDDIRAGKATPKIAAGETHFDFDVDGLTVVLVDDVIAAGRTVRAALDEVMDYGRPRRIQLACLIDRGTRELPIQADFLGKTLNTMPEDHVAVRLEETDGEDVVILRRRRGEDTAPTGD